MKILSRKMLDRIFHLCAGDSLNITWYNHDHSEVLLTHTINATESMVVDEAVLFETVFEQRRALGGMVIERKIN